MQARSSLSISTALIFLARLDSVTALPAFTSTEHTRSEASSWETIAETHDIKPSSAPLESVPHPTNYRQLNIPDGSEPCQISCPSDTSACYVRCSPAPPYPKFGPNPDPDVVCDDVCFTTLPQPCPDLEPFPVCACVKKTGC